MSVDITRAPYRQSGNVVRDSSTETRLWVIWVIWLIRTRLYTFYDVQEGWVFCWSNSLETHSAESIIPFGSDQFCWDLKNVRLRVLSIRSQKCHVGNCHVDW